ncbi:NAD(P)/FAD-dependent oxidoreductase [Halioxenophilus aromaticivorans]|uniref:Cyanide-forming glycine dehydrogenase subunit HcnB n=1 Tax=Halioxenophilus aromaticivorans TaxID=1306992 RepID=A0AAV3TYY9_9ALTE
MTELQARDVGIIGAGPAGLAAAETLAQYGFSVVIFDEQLTAGGQIFRQPPRGFKNKNWLKESLYKAGRDLVHRAEKNASLQWRLGVTVQGVVTGKDSDGSDIFTVIYQNLADPKSRGIHEQLCRKVLLATGCHEAPIAFPGWNTPGVMMAGGMQAFIKSQSIVPGDRFVFSGTHPLQIVVASQIVEAGGSVGVVAFAQSWRALGTAFKSPLAVLRYPKKLLYIFKCLLVLMRAKVPIWHSTIVTRAIGADELEQVDFKRQVGSARADMSDGTGDAPPFITKTIAANRLALCFNFSVSSELAKQAGAQTVWSRENGGYLVKHNEWQESSKKGLFVAGEITMMAGADAAMDEGTLAALGIVMSEGPEGTLAKEIGRRAKKVRKNLAKQLEFANVLKAIARSGESYDQLEQVDTLICKCENVSVSEFLQIVEDNPQATSVNSLKLLSRAGMGMCQGRYCHRIVKRILAERYDRSEASTGDFSAQFPAKPISIEAFLEQ